MHCPLNVKLEKGSCLGKIARTVHFGIPLGVVYINTYGY